MSEMNSFGVPWVLNRPNMPPVKFPLLSMRQTAEAQALIRSNRVAAAKAHVAEQKAKPEEATRYLTTVSVGLIDLADVRQWAMTPEGAEAILKLSLGDSFAQVITTVSPVQAVEAALRVTGWEPETDLDRLWYDLSVAVRDLKVSDEDLCAKLLAIRTKIKGKETETVANP